MSSLPADFALSTRTRDISIATRNPPNDAGTRAATQIGDYIAD